MICVISSPKNFLAAVQSSGVPCWSDLEAEGDHLGNLPDPHWTRINSYVVNCAKVPSLFVTAAEPVLTSEQIYCEAHTG